MTQAPTAGGPDIIEIGILMVLRNSRAARGMRREKATDLPPAWARVFADKPESRKRSARKGTRGRARVPADPRDITIDAGDEGKVRIVDLMSAPFWRARGTARRIGGGPDGH